MAVTPADYFRQGRTLLIVQGICALLLGIMVIIWPITATQVFAILMGAWLIVSGIVSITAWAGRPRGMRSGWALTRAIFSIIAGLIVFFIPAAGMLALLWIVAFVMLLVGVFQISGSFSFKAAGARTWWLMLLTGILSIIAGVCLMIYPGTGLIVLAWVVGIAMIVEGISAFVLAGHLSKISREAGEARWDDARWASPRL